MYKLRSHQKAFWEACKEAAEDLDIKEIIADVTPGGGKSLLPIIAMEELFERRINMLLWVVPRLSLRNQAEKQFKDPKVERMCREMGIGWSGYQLNAVDEGNTYNPSYGLNGYITTYQAIAINKVPHVQEFMREGFRYGLVLDELHHCYIDDEGKDSDWLKNVRELAALSAFNIFMFGSRVRSDRFRIGLLDYIDDPNNPRFKRLDISPNKSRRLVTYTRRQALMEGAINPYRFLQWNAKNLEWSEMSLKDGSISQHSAESLRALPSGDRSAAIHTALKSPATEDLIKKFVILWMKHQKKFNSSKCIIVAHGQDEAERYRKIISTVVSGNRISLAIDREGPEALRAIDRFKLDNSKLGAADILITVRMAYEGLDVPEISHGLILTTIRKIPWLEQCVARCVRIDENIPKNKKQWAHIVALADKEMTDFFKALKREQEGIALVIEKDPGVEGLPPSGRIVIPKDGSLGEAEAWSHDLPPVDDYVSYLTAMSMLEALNLDDHQIRTMAEILRDRDGIRKARPLATSDRAVDNRTDRAKRKEERGKINRHVKSIAAALKNVHNGQFGDWAVVVNQLVNFHGGGGKRKDMNLEQLGRCSAFIASNPDWEELLGLKKRGG